MVTWGGAWRVIKSRVPTVLTPIPRGGCRAPILRVKESTATSALKKQERTNATDPDRRRHRNLRPRALHRSSSPGALHMPRRSTSPSTRARRRCTTTRRQGQAPRGWGVETGELYRPAPLGYLTLDFRTALTAEQTLISKGRHASSEACQTQTVTLVVTDETLRAHGRKPPISNVHAKEYPLPQGMKKKTHTAARRKVHHNGEKKKGTRKNRQLAIVV